MKRIFTRIVTVLALMVVSTALAHAQASRTWVSGVGDDANPCSRTAPGKTFAGAISKTAAGGEIDCLDPGGFGALTITKSITIDGGGGQVASVLVAGTNGIVINAGANDVVILRNLRIQGLGPGSTNQGLSGIVIVQCGHVEIENCEIDNFSLDGIHLDTTTNCNLSVSHTRLVNCANVGFFVHSTATVRSTITSCETQKCHFGVEARSGVVTVTNTVAAHGGIGFRSDSAGSITLTRCVTSGNTYGIDAETGTGIAIDDCDIIGNGTGIFNGGGHVASAGNNRNIANSTPGAPTGPLALQ
jgi:hypothetical protein